MTSSFLRFEETKASVEEVIPTENKSTKVNYSVRKCRCIQWTDLQWSNTIFIHQNWSINRDQLSNLLAVSKTRIILNWPHKQKYLFINGCLSFKHILELFNKIRHSNNSFVRDD
jgi:hypothetical protein